MADRTVRQDLVESFGMTDDQVDDLVLRSVGADPAHSRITAIKDLRNATGMDLHAGVAALNALIREEGLDG